MAGRASDKTKQAPAARGGPQSVGRILAILEALAGNNQGATLSELAESTGAPKTSLVGLLAGLTAEGCLVRDEGSRYYLGTRFLSLAMRAVAGREVIELVRPILADLAETSGETAVLGGLAPDADVAIYLDKVESSNPIRYGVTVGERRELYCTAVGKVLLAYFEPDRLQAHLQSVPREKFTANTKTGQRELLAELKQVREEALSRTGDERVMGASGVAAPVFAHDGTVAAVALIAGPSERMQANAKTNERLVRDAAAAGTRLIGGAPPATGESEE